VQLLRPHAFLVHEHVQPIYSFLIFRAISSRRFLFYYDCNETVLFEMRRLPFLTAHV
jgi:hypothetical protein